MPNEAAVKCLRLTRPDETEPVWELSLSSDRLHIFTIGPAQLRMLAADAVEEHCRYCERQEMA
jgi:hypothetical protein